ncbi:MAG: ABC transporter ATP-binding protein [Clostridia bacterium]|nr:ABC transporter ATP-binding protein [Clostridia bacterium]
MGPPRGANYDNMKPKKPSGIKDVPRYLRELLSGFTSRLFYIFRLVWEAKPWILFLMLGHSVINGLLPVVGALISKELINSLVNTAVKREGDFSSIMKLLILQFGFIFISAVISLVYNMIIRISGELVTNHIKLKILRKTKEIDIASFDMPEFYEKLENASREAGMRPISILQSVFGIISTIISLVSFIIILASVTPLAPIAIIVFSIPTAVISFVYRKKNFEYIRRRSKDRRQMQYYSDLMTNKDMVKEIRMFNLSDTLINCYKETFGRYFLGIKKLTYAESGWSVGVSLASSGVNCALFLYIAKKVHDGLIAVGDYTLYTGALQSIASGIAGLISTFSMIYEGTLFIDNMIAFMKEESHIKPNLPEPAHVTRGIAHRIEFKNVWFTYPGSDHPVIKNVNLTIREGETAVLVGLNGAGKTTLIKLLTRLYDPTEGVILLDGRDIKNYDIEELYDTFGIIFQDFGKYAFTAGENIMFGDVEQGYDEARIKEAAISADADTFISKLKNGYNTSLMKYFEPDGTELSIGQWQKLSIARAFYSDSDILILDEPTASLDAIAEQEIFNQFEQLREGKTTLFVSHRLSSATTATKIFVIENGELVEEGTHAELMALGGKYCNLFTTQAKRYVTGSSDESKEEDKVNGI